MDKTREAAIRYVGANYDKEQLDMLLSEETTPHPVHEEPLIQAFIAGVNSKEHETEVQRRFKIKLLDKLSEKSEEIRKLIADISFKDFQIGVLEEEKKNPWISVDSELPEIECGTLSAECFVKTKGNAGACFFSAYYDCQFQDWYLHNVGYSKMTSFRITKWMLIPKDNE